MSEEQPKLIILQGLPASGKSTYANRYKNTINTNTEIVNSETIRKRLGFINSDYTLKNNLEHIVKAERDKQIVKHLLEGKTVISDDTNLNDYTLRHLIQLSKQANAKVVKRYFNVPVQECIRRNEIRNTTRKSNDKTPNRLIYSMASRYHIR